MFLEHVNMSVSNVDRTIEFYQHVLGLKVRWRGANKVDQPAAHIGDDRHYLALFQVGEREHTPADYGAIGLNHFGWVVDDLDEVKGRLASLNVTPHLVDDYEPGRRLYFFDPDGIEVELVEYGEGGL